MCKHILFNNYDHDRDLETLKTFADLTYDQDGFGAIIRRKDKTIETIKAIDVVSFYIDLVRRLDKTVETLVVHHRTSTNGHGVEYSHPFEFQGVHLTHNGVVSVPEKHDTLTTNDSEALLHHLVKHNLDTSQVSGYFSVFLVTADYIKVIVDDTAPMFTDGRVWSSHKIGDDWQKKTMVMIDLETMTETPISKVVSSYGYDKASLSLGWAEKPETYSTYDSGFYFDHYDNVDDFLRFLSDQDEIEIVETRSEIDRYFLIKEKAHYYGIKLTDHEVTELTELYN